MSSPFARHHWKMKSLFDLPSRLQDKIMPCPTTGCWIWIGAASENGYGNAKIAKTRKRASTHRMVYELLIGPIPEGLHIDHLCRLRSCCNPLHMEPVTPAENILRGFSVAAIAKRRSCCLNGHEYTEENTRIRHGKRHCRECERKRALIARRQMSRERKDSRNEYQRKRHAENPERDNVKNRQSYHRHRAAISERRKLKRSKDRNKDLPEASNKE